VRVARSAMLPFDDDRGTLERLVRGVEDTAIFRA
jgi:hypothetical protein